MMLDKLSPQQRELCELRELVTELRHENARLMRHIRGEHVPIPLSLGLTRIETKFLACLMSAQDGYRPHEVLYTALYAGKEISTENILATVVRRIRPKLHAYGITILTRHGQGYELPPASRALISAATTR